MMNFSWMSVDNVSLACGIKYEVHFERNKSFEKKEKKHLDQ